MNNLTMQNKQLNIPDQKQFWSDFFNATQDLKLSQVFTHYSANQIVDFADVNEVLNSIAVHYSPAQRYGLRVYINNAQHTEYESKILQQPPNLHDSLQAWATQLFQGQRFGLIINQAERWSNNLCAKITNFLQPFREKYGIFRDLLEIVIFIGNYGYTPFGIHYDGDSIFNIHLHLGPGQKTMYLWEPQLYKTLHGSYEFCYTPEKLINSGQPHVIPANAIYHLPANHYHVGYTEDFSVGIALSFLRNTNKEFLTAAVKNKLEHSLAALPEFRLENQHFNNINDIEKISSNFCQNIFAKNIQLKDFAKQAITERLLSIASNAGIKNLPHRKKTALDNIDKFKKLANFPIYHLKDTKHNKLILFIRGQRIVIKNNDAIIKLLELLNTNQIVNLNELIYSDKTGINTADLKNFIAILASYGAIIANP